MNPNLPFPERAACLRSGMTRTLPVVVVVAVATLALFAGCSDRTAAGTDHGGATSQAVKPTADQLAAYKAKLTAEQYHVMFEEGTEPPFQNAYHDNHAAGTYVSAATGKPLFTSDDKFESGTGWPSFVKPIDAAAVIVRTDADGSRDEVIDASSGAHLGHVFNDGPSDRGGKRFCMNSAALKFIPKGEAMPTTMP